MAWRAWRNKVVMMITWWDDGCPFTSSFSNHVKRHQFAIMLLMLRLLHVGVIRCDWTISVEAVNLVRSDSGIAGGRFDDHYPRGWRQSLQINDIWNEWGRTFYIDRFVSWNATEWWTIRDTARTQQCVSDSIERWITVVACFMGCNIFLR
jgi:hypothetical protein